MGFFSSCKHKWRSTGDGDHKLGKATHKCTECNKVEKCNADVEESHNSSLDSTHCSECRQYMLVKVGIFGGWN